MDEDKVPAQASAEDEERTKVRKAQEVMGRTSASVGQVCLIILTLLAILYTLYFAAGIILPFVLALVLTMVLGPAMRLMNRRLHIPRMIAALLLIIALFSVVGASSYALSVPASAWIAKAPQSLPALMDKLSFLRRPIQLMEQGVQQLQNAMSQSEQEPADQSVVTVKQPSDVSGHILGIGSTVFAGGRAFLGQGFTVMLLLFFFLASSESLLRRFVEILPHFDDKRRAVSIVTAAVMAGLVAFGAAEGGDAHAQAPDGAPSQAAPGAAGQAGKAPRRARKSTVKTRVAADPGLGHAMSGRTPELRVNPIACAEYSG